MSRLLMIAPAPVIELGDGKLRLDVKFVEGMRIHTALWDGPVSCVLKAGVSEIPFGATYDRAELDFDLQIVAPNQPINIGDLASDDLIFAGADMHEVLHLAAPDQRPNGAKIVFSIEYDLGTRMRIAALDRDKGPLRKLRTGVWLLQQERRRRIALRASDGIQANGYPAYKSYSKLNDRTLLYLDGRMASVLMATQSEQGKRAAYLRSGAPLRLIHSGRLEPMKGGQDLVPTAIALRNAGVEFTLDIFGAGSLEAEIAESVANADLSDCVTLHKPVDFETILVPFMRQNADLFLSCHRQSDPSCTYLESLGCGVPVVGYQNGMWRELSVKSGGGWAVPMGQTTALVDAISRIDREREALVVAGQKGLEFARRHDFETEFSLRMKHLSNIAGSA